MSKKTIAVIGSGAAALSLAAAFPPSYEVTVITKKRQKQQFCLCTRRDCCGLCKR